MGIIVSDLFRNPNVGIYAKANENSLFLPEGLPQNKMNKLSTILKVDVHRISIGGSRLIGALMAFNSRGILVSRMIEDDELASIRNATRLPIEKFPSNHTATGNLIAVNDFGAIVSPILTTRESKVASNILDVPVEQASIASYIQTGVMVLATNRGGVIHPRASLEEIEIVKQILKIDVEPCTVNGGVPFVSSGLVGNSKGLIIGSHTAGPELAILGRAFML